MQKGTFDENNEKEERWQKLSDDNRTTDHGPRCKPYSYMNIDDRPNPYDSSQTERRVVISASRGPFHQKKKGTRQWTDPSGGEEVVQC